MARHSHRTKLDCQAKITKGLSLTRDSQSRTLSLSLSSAVVILVVVVVGYAEGDQQAATLEIIITLT